MTTSVYDPMGRQVAAIDALGYVTTTTYDARGQVTSRQDALGYLTTSLYDVLGRTLAQVDALGRLSTSVYDPLGRTSAIVNALGERTSMAYDAVGNRLAVMNGLGYATSYSYDVLDRQAGWMDPLGRQHTLSYDAVGRIQIEVDAKGQVTTHTYNGRGEETYRLFADGQSVSMVYDHAGQSVQVWDSAGVFTHSYDADGRLQSVLGPDYPGRVPVTYAYDGAGNRVGMASWWGVFTYGYDARGQMTTLADPGAYYVDGGTTTMAYDARGQRVAQQWANGTRASYVYDAVGRTLSAQHFDHFGGGIGGADYAYDVVGRPLFKDTYMAHHTYSYDALDRLTGEEVGGLIGPFPAFSHDQPVPAQGYQRLTWAYDAAGRRTNQQGIEMQKDPKGGKGSPLIAVPAVTTYTYDAADELLTAASSLHGVTSYAYDANGSRVEMVVPLGQVATYAWDAANRLQTIRPLSGGIYTETYRADGLRHTQARPVANSSLSNGVEVSLWDEASAGDLSPLSWKGRVKTSATLVGTDTVTQGGWKSRTSGGSNYVNTYGNEGYEVASGGQALPGFSNLPRYAQFSLGGFAYKLWDNSTTDVRGLQQPGNLTDRIAAAWLGDLIIDLNLLDERPHLVSLYLLDWDSLSRNGSVTVTDAETNAVLVSQSVSSYGNGIWLNLRLSGHVQIAITNFTASVPDAGAVLSGVFFDPVPYAERETGPPELLSQVFVQGSELVTASGVDRRNNSVDRKYHLDALGSLESLRTVNAPGGSGDALTTFLMPVDDAFGSRVSAGPEKNFAPNTTDNPFLFLGGLGYWQEPDLGLAYVRARWLDTTTAQWMSVDPVDGEPRYSYAHQEPTTQVDPSGTKPPADLQFIDDALHLIFGPTLEPARRFAFTGKPFASDQVYDDALEGGVEGAEEAIIRPFRRGGVFGVLKKALGDIRRYKGQLEYLWRFHAYSITANLPPIARSEALFYLGFEWGLTEAAFGVLTAGVDVVEFIVQLHDNPKLYANLVEIAKTVFGAVVGGLFDDIGKNVAQAGQWSKLSSYERGVLCARFITLALRVALLVLGIVKAGLAVGDFIKTAPKRLEILSNATANGIAAYKWAKPITSTVDAAKFGVKSARFFQQTGSARGNLPRLNPNTPLHESVLEELFHRYKGNSRQTNGTGSATTSGAPGKAGSGSAGHTTALSPREKSLAAQAARTELQQIRAAEQIAAKPPIRALPPVPSVLRDRVEALSAALSDLAENRRIIASGTRAGRFPLTIGDKTEAVLAVRYSQYLTDYRKPKKFVDPDGTHRKTDIDVGLEKALIQVTITQLNEGDIRKFGSTMKYTYPGVNPENKTVVLFAPMLGTARKMVTDRYAKLSGGKFIVISGPTPLEALHNLDEFVKNIHSH